MITITQDRKSPTYIITKTDGEGYHRQMNVSEEEIMELAAMLKLEIRN